MAHFKINMQQFREKIKVFSDNVDMVNTIDWTNGHFKTSDRDAQKYVDLLCEYNIFFTMTKVA